MQPPAVTAVLLLSACCCLAPCTVTAAASMQGASDRLYVAAVSNQVEDAKAAIAAGADLNAKGRGGQTPIMAATLSGSTEIVRFLLEEHGNAVDLSIGEKDGYTPMHGAGFQGRAEVARLLVKAGLDPSSRHHDGYTPIHRACWGSEPRHTATVKVLLEDGKVDVNELSNGMTPLDSALRSANKGTTELLRSRGGQSAAELSAGSEAEL